MFSSQLLIVILIKINIFLIFCFLFYFRSFLWWLSFCCFNCQLRRRSLIFTWGWFFSRRLTVLSFLHLLYVCFFVFLLKYSHFRTYFLFLFCNFLSSRFTSRRRQWLGFLFLFLFTLFIRTWWIFKETLTTSLNILLLQILLCVLIHCFPFLNDFSYNLWLPDFGELKFVLIKLYPSKLPINLRKPLAFLSHLWISHLNNFKL